MQELIKHGADISSPSNWLELVQLALDHKRYDVIAVFVRLTGGDLLRDKDVRLMIDGLIHCRARG